MDPDELDGLFDTIQSEERVDVPEKQTPEPEQPKSVEPEKQTQTAEEDPKVETPENPEEPQGEPENPETPTDPEAEPSKTETQTENPTDEYEWKKFLPLPPTEYNGPMPEVDDEGNITNMDRSQYEQYLEDRASYASDKRDYMRRVEYAALEAAEKILPELATNPAVRQLVENQRLMDIYAGKESDSFEAAKVVRDALGIAPEKLNAAKAEGNQNAKVHIETQKVAAVGDGGQQPKSESSEADKQLARRLAKGNDLDAFAELFDSWEKDGKVF